MLGHKHNPINIEIRGEASGERAAGLLSALIDCGKLPSFVDALLNRHNAYHDICMMEDDVMAFEHRNRWCGAADGWMIVVGRCSFPEPHLENVPTYTGWGGALGVQAWLQYEDSFVTIGTAGRGPDEADVLVWDPDEFVASHGAEVFVRAAFADNSAMVLNRSFRAIAELEVSFADGVPNVSGADYAKVTAQVLAAMERQFDEPREGGEG